MTDVRHPAPPECDALVAALNDLLSASLRALADTGQVEEACRLAGRACALYRRTDAKAWNRFNGLLHRFAARSSRDFSAVSPDRARASPPFRRE
ncbi:MAG: hypothetical protein R3E69_14225 [Steroidobacteraceae bacterium]